MSSRSNSTSGTSSFWFENSNLRSMNAVAADWDEWLRSVGAQSSFTQSSIWARIHETVNGVRPVFVELRVEGQRRAGCLLGLRSAATPGLARQAVQWATGTFGPTLECFTGPVLAPGATLEDLRQLLIKIDEVAAEVRAVSLRFVGRPSAAQWPEEPAVSERFAARGYEVVPWMTAIVDVQRSDSELLKGFRQAARKGIRRCAEEKISVRPCADENEYVQDFSRPLFETRRALGFDIPAGRENVQWWQLDPDRHYRYFVARAADGTVLGTLGTYRWNGLVTEIMSERTMTARQLKLPVQDILHWEAFRVHRDLGDTWFDLAGFNPNPADSKEEGISSFKRKWCGREVAVPTYQRSDLTFCHRVAASALRLARQMRRKGEARYG
jgi:lipid II:glycine glycyltransferase (peptidoglycan interpeptide bridge formation enzyme)